MHLCDCIQTLVHFFSCKGYLLTHEMSENDFFLHSYQYCSRKITREYNAITLFKGQRIYEASTTYTSIYPPLHT